MQYIKQASPNIGHSLDITIAATGLDGTAWVGAFSIGSVNHTIQSSGYTGYGLPLYGDIVLPDAPQDNVFAYTYAGGNPAITGHSYSCFDVSSIFNEENWRLHANGTLEWTNTYGGYVGTWTADTGGITLIVTSQSFYGPKPDTYHFTPVPGIYNGIRMLQLSADKEVPSNFSNPVYAQGAVLNWSVGTSADMAYKFWTTGSGATQPGLTDPPMTITLGGAYGAYAGVYALQRVPVTLTLSKRFPNEGTLSADGTEIIAEQSYGYLSGDLATVELTQAGGEGTNYTFVEWAVNQDGNILHKTTPTATVRMKTNESALCYCNSKIKYTVNVEQQANGSSGLSGGGEYTEGDTVHIATGVELPGFVYLGFALEGNRYTSSGQYSIDIPFLDQDYDFIACFAKIDVAASFTASYGQNTTITGKLKNPSPLPSDFDGQIGFDLPGCVKDMGVSGDGLHSIPAGGELVVTQIITGLYSAIEEGRFYALGASKDVTFIESGDFKRVYPSYASTPDNPLEMCYAIKGVQYCTSVPGYDPYLPPYIDIPYFADSGDDSIPVTISDGKGPIWSGTIPYTPDPYWINLPDPTIPPVDPNPIPNPEDGGDPAVDKNYQGCVESVCVIPYIYAYSANSAGILLQSSDSSNIITSEGLLLTS